MSNNGAGHVAAAIFISFYDTYKGEPDPAARSAIVRAARKAWIEQWACGIDYGTYDICEFGSGIDAALKGLGLMKEVPSDGWGDTEHVYYWYAQGEDQGPMSVNYPWGAALEITQWTVQEPEEGSDVLGSVKGRVVLVMADDAESWVGGEFDAPYYEW